MPVSSLSAKLSSTVQDNVLGFLSELNVVSSSHKQLISGLINNYVNQFLGVDPPTRTVWAAHPGLGKTTCLRFFLLEVIRCLRSGELRQADITGILVCSNQVTELEDHVLFLEEHLGQPPNEIGLYHTKQDGNQFKARTQVASLNELSECPIIFVTQNLVRRKGADLHNHKRKAQGRLEEVCYYNDCIRFLCWDEEAIATKACHASINMLREFVRRVEEGKPAPALDPLMSIIKQIIEQIESSKRNSKSFNIRVPSLESEDYSAADCYLRSEGANREYGQNYVKQACQILNWQGESAVAYESDNGIDDTVMNFDIELPDALERAVITDASAAANHLVMLDPTINQAPFILQHGHALKRYDQVSIYIKPIPAGRYSFTNGQGIGQSWYKPIRDAFKLLPRDESLVITFKGPDPRPNAHIDEVKEILGEHDLSRFHFTTWGKHRASNDWSQCMNVFLFGTLHLDEQVLAASARAQTRHPLQDTLQPYTSRQLAYSQIASDIQQALSRGSCRQVTTINDVTQANPMSAFLGLSKRELPHVVKHLRECFPGVRILDADTHHLLNTDDYNSDQEKVAGCIEEYLLAAPTVTVKTKEMKRWIEDQLGISLKDRNLWNRSRDKAKTPGWIRRPQDYTRDSYDY